jgi:hypothetical protein
MQTIVTNISGHNARVNIQSIDNSKNEVVGDHELKDALAKISAAIEASGNKDAAESWTDFLEEAAGKKSKSKLKAFWDRTVSLAPDIATLTAAAAKVAKVRGSAPAVVFKPDPSLLRLPWSKDRDRSVGVRDQFASEFDKHHPCGQTEMGPVVG